MAFKRATKEQAKLRLALIGPPGSGKTYTALKIARELGSRIAVIDSERGSAAKYADEFQFDHDVLEIFSPNRYMAAINEAWRDGYNVLIIDSLSHAWMGKDGILETVDKVTARSKSRNAFTEGWREASPLHNQLVDTMLQANLHIIVTMRTKTEYVIEEVNGKKVPRKVGLAPVQRDGLEYEFDVVADMEEAGERFIVTKTRCKALKGAVVREPGEDVAGVLKAWLTDGAPPAEPPAPPPVPRPAPVQEAPTAADLAREAEAGLQNLRGSGSASEGTDRRPAPAGNGQQNGNGGRRLSPNPITAAARKNRSLMELRLYCDAVHGLPTLQHGVPETLFPAILKWAERPGSDEAVPEFVQAWLGEQMDAAGMTPEEIRALEEQVGLVPFDENLLSWAQAAKMYEAVLQRRQAIERRFESEIGRETRDIARSVVR